MSRESLAIARLGARGDGVADTPEGPVYVAGALPGEIVAVLRQGERGELLEVDSPSPERVAPFCPLAGRCGGCATQHMGEALYRRWKRGLVQEALARAGVAAATGELLDAHGAGRRRATFHGRRQGSGWLVGFMAARSHEIVPVEACPVLEPRLAGAPKAALALATRLGGSKPLDIQITATDTGIDADIRGHGPLNDKGRQQAMIALAAELDLARLSLHGETLVERRAPRLAMGAASVSPPPGGFLQATAAGEAALAGLVLAALPPKAKRVADLFSGCGPFALRLAERAQVQAFDSDRPAISALDRAWREAKGLKGVAAEARDLFRRPLLPSELEPFDMLLLDPPRAGAEAQTRQIAASAAERLVYVSCNPASFARDAEVLIAAGFALDPVTPVDQFRHSGHVELVGVFRRNRRC